MADAEDRTEAASGRRLERARAEGQSPLSREVASFAVLASGALLLSMTLPAGIADQLPGLRSFLADADRLSALSALHAALWQAATLLAPFAGAAFLAGSASVLLQTGFLLNLSALQPDLSRLDPRQGLRRVFGFAPAVEGVKSLFKIGVVGWAAWSAVATLLPVLASAMLWDPARLLRATASEIARLLVAMLLVQGVIVAADVVRVRLKHARSLRMSRQELREEHREAEGDPQIKAKIRQLRQQRARRRMLASVPKAVVVVTNPTHYAVALAYERGSAAPRVVAKGVDGVAARIREVAQAARVPVVANPPLARALYRVEIDTDIPSEHYQMVAELIAYVWRLRARASGARL